MPTAILCGNDDAELTAALSELLCELGARLVTEAPSRSADVALVLVASPAELDEHLGVARRQAPGAPVVVLLQFWLPALAHRATARGAAACHALDQPIAQLSTTLRRFFDASARRAAGDVA